MKFSKCVTELVQFIIDSSARRSSDIEIDNWPRETSEKNNTATVNRFVVLLGSNQSKIIYIVVEKCPAYILNRTNAWKELQNHQKSN